MYGYYRKFKNIQLYHMEYLLKQKGSHLELSVKSWFWYADLFLNNDVTFN